MTTTVFNPAATLPHPAKERIYYLDNLRSFIILVVVVFHAALAYMVFFPWWWPVVDTHQNLFFTGLVLLTDDPIMPIMFMIAGYFGLGSLIRYGQAGFWREKLLRIVTPWLLGWLLIAPWSPYFFLLSRLHHPPSFPYFWLHMFFTKTFNQQGVLWFLGVLTVFYLGLSAVYALYKPLGRIAAQGGRPSGLFWIGFLLVPAAVFVFINQFWFDFQWVPVHYVLWVQPTRVSLEAFYFALGVYAYRQQWFAADGYRPRFALWLPVAAVTGAVFLVYKLKVGFLMPLFAERAVHGLLHCFFCLCTTLALVGLFQKYLNRTNPFFSRLALGSYPIYVIHLPIVFFFNLMVRGYDWNIFLKYGVVCALSLVVSYLIGAYVLVLLPMFSPRKRPSHAPASALA
ncbi:MAG: acyltransferase family protein [Terracidiphilus sp.]